MIRMGGKKDEKSMNCCENEIRSLWLKPNGMNYRFIKWQ